MTHTKLAAAISKVAAVTCWDTDRNGNRHFRAELNGNSVGWHLQAGSDYVRHVLSCHGVFHYTIKGAVSVLVW